MSLLDIIHAAIREDMPSGDLTTESMAVAPRPGRARLVAKEDIVLSGAAPFEQTILALDPNARVKWSFEEGERVLKKQNICTIQGDLIQILKAERLALNFLGRLSGIATITRAYVDMVKATKTKILDTRKTTPTFRELEKRAVLHGGGINHRVSLSDAILIKDNHIVVMGGIKAAVQRVRAHTDLPIEIEADTFEKVKEAVEMKVHRILLDNMSNGMMAEAIALIPQPIEIEASGNMTLDRVASVAQLGVHFISVGALTHSAPCADVSMQFEWGV